MSEPRSLNRKSAESEPLVQSIGITCAQTVFFGLFQSFLLNTIIGVGFVVYKLSVGLEPLTA